jgi:hypothetical protein
MEDARNSYMHSRAVSPTFTTHVSEDSLRRNTHVLANRLCVKVYFVITIMTMIIKRFCIARFSTEWNQGVLEIIE